MRKIVLTALIAVTIGAYLSMKPRVVSTATNMAAAPPSDRVISAMPAKPNLVPAASPAGASITKLSEGLDQLQSCYERDCGFPRTDEKSYDFALGQAIQAETVKLTNAVGAVGLHDPALTARAVALLANEDGNVQEGALALLATQPTSAEALEAILERVVGGYDAQLIQQALRELMRYRSDDEQTRIAAALAAAMVTGAPFVAKEVSGGIRPFLSGHTLPEYEDAGAQLPTGSLVRTQLEQAIADFRASRS